MVTEWILCISVSSPGITVLLSLTVFMLLVAEIMPATSDSVPLIGKVLFFIPYYSYFDGLLSSQEKRNKRLANDYLHVMYEIDSVIIIMYIQDLTD